MEMPGIDRRHRRRRLLLIEVGAVALVALLLIFLMPCCPHQRSPQPNGAFFSLSDRSPRH
jgi:hypothetical protein